MAMIFLLLCSLLFWRGIRQALLHSSYEEQESSSTTLTYQPSDTPGTTPGRSTTATTTSSAATTAEIIPSSTQLGTTGYRITTGTENSRTATSKGRRFIVAFTQNDETPATLALELSSYDEPCMVQVTVPSPPYNQTVLLAKNSTTEVVFPTNYMLTAGERSRKLVTVSSDADISVIAFNIADLSADAFTCLSKQDLGTEYFVFTAVSWYGSHFAVGNGEDVETQVNITVSGSLLVDGTRYQDKEMVTITLAPQEVILLSDTNDLTGTRVVSSTPVAVFSGSACYSSLYSLCDTLIEQLYPVQSWGQQFVVFPLMTKDVRDRIIIIAARPNTTITLRTESTTLQHSLQPGSHVSMDLQTGMLVDATEPIMVGYLFQGCYSPLPFIFDPFLATVPPSNFPWRYYKFVTKDIFYNYLFIVSRSSSSSSDFLLDYRPLSDYAPTEQDLEGFTGWEVNLGKNGGQHEISHQSETFGIYVYGVENDISYGYSLGQAQSFSAQHYLESFLERKRVQTVGQSPQYDSGSFTRSRV
ncbi:IgGFc-binding protein-like [Lissotriton helveticus]